MVFEIESPIFTNRAVFNKKYIPTKIMHRDVQIREVEDRLKWALMGSKPKDHIIYGYGGTGKTMISLYVAAQLCNRTPDATYLYVNLKEANTEVRALNAILHKLCAKTSNTSSAQELFKRIFQHIETLPHKHMIFILDEIDKVKIGYDGLLYCFLRTNEVSDLSKEITIIAISNDFNFPAELEIGTRSSFAYMDKLDFPRYTAEELLDIIKQRAIEGLKEGTYNNGVLELCAAYGAQEHGDARKTIELLEKSVEIAMMEKSPILKEEHVRSARDQNEYEGVYHGVKTLPLQCKAVALACARDFRKRRATPTEHESTASTIYTEYKQICKLNGVNTLTQRRILDILNDLGCLGLVSCTHRYNNPHKGRNKVIEFIVDAKRIENMITDEDRFSMFRTGPVQTKLGE